MVENVSVTIRGQSNALLFADTGGASRLEQALEAKLPGVDVHMLYQWGSNDGRNTINSGTEFLNEWMAGTEAGPLQQGYLDYIGALPADVRDNPTLELFLHNESDQKLSGSFSASDWTAAYEANAGMVENAFGHDVATTFVPIRYNWGDIGPILDGMEQAVANGTAAGIDMSAYDLAKMDWGGVPNTEHMSGADAQVIADALANNLADDVAALAAGGEPLPSEPPPPPPAEEPDPVPETLTTVLEDDFEGGYKAENWGQPFDGGVYWNGAWSWSKDDVRVSDVGGEHGKVMDLTMTRHADGSWTGGGFNSFKAGKDILYGTIEFDGKVEEAQGTMGVFLTWATQDDDWPAQGEIDILETPGQDVMHTTHWEDASGGHSYDAVRNQSYDETQWNRYEVTWLPDLLKIEVNGDTVAEWTDPAMIPDVAHGIGAMGFVGSPNDGWIGGAPDGSTPQQVHVLMDNVVMKQWNGGELPPTDGEEPTDPEPEPGEPVPTPPPPPAPGGADIAATAGADVFAFRPGDGYANDGPFAIAGFEPGEDRLDVQAHDGGNGWVYDPWAEDTAEGTVVQWSWGAEEKVLLRGVHGVALADLLDPADAVEPPPPPPPVDPVPEPTPPVVDNGDDDDLVFRAEGHGDLHFEFGGLVFDWAGKEGSSLDAVLDADGLHAVQTDADGSVQVFDQPFV